MRGGMKVGDVLSSRTKQRFILAARAADHSRTISREFIDAELSMLDDPHATSVEMCTSVVSAVGQMVIEVPVAVVVGAGELFRRR